MYNVYIIIIIINIANIVHVINIDVNVDVVDAIKAGEAVVNYIIKKLSVKR